MNTIRFLAACLAVIASLPASAAVFTFEGTPESTGLTTLAVTNAGLTATITRPGATFGIEDISIAGGPAAFGSRTLEPFSGGTGNTPFVVNFSALQSSVSVTMGDFSPSDIDTLVLRAFAGVGGTGTLLGTTTVGLPNTSGFDVMTLTTAFPSIQSIVMIGGSTGSPNSVFYDNITTSAVTPPTPAPDAGSAAVLLMLGMTGIVMLRRRLA